MGLNALKAGAGIPLTDIWNENFGAAVAYIGGRPENISLPVRADNGTAELSVERMSGFIPFGPGDSLVTVKSAIIIHEGDFFEALKQYSGLVHPLLPAFLKPTDEAYRPEWCTWGYNTNFTAGNILGKISTLKQLGFKSVIIDDGWSVSHGDWVPDPEKFPGGDKDFRKLTDTLHKAGLRVRLWWIPGYADSTSSLARLHPDWLVRNSDGSVHRSYALCPAYAPVKEYYKNLVRKFTEVYGLDGFKLDFSEINTAPPCYNPVHRHNDPYDSYDGTPELFRIIYETARKYNPGILIEYCACGIPPNIYHLPYVNLAVTSDPSIGQITNRIKMYKALIGPDRPVLEEYCGVLAGPVYPLVTGSGGVPGTFSTYLDDYHKKWLDIYSAKGLSNGEYLNLYNTGFDYPEGHVIKKTGNFYFAFYTHPWEKLEKKRWYRYGTEFDGRKEGHEKFEFPPEKWSGKLELRGLDPKRNYRIVNYETESEIGNISGNNPYVEISFVNYLLLEALPLR